MKTYTTSQDQDFTVNYASSLSSGHGHKKINALVVAENGEKKEFHSVTSNMPDFDEATDLEGQEKFDALFSLVESSLDGEIAEWIYSLEN